MGVGARGGETLRTGAQGRHPGPGPRAGETLRTGAQGRRSGPGPGRGDAQDRGPGRGYAQDRGPGETLRAGPRAMITEGRLVVLEGEVPRGSVLLTAVRSP